MANYASTVLLEARAKQQDKYAKKFEGRPVNSMLMDLFLRNRDITIPNLADLRSSTTRATKIIYPTKTDYTINSTKSCSPTGEQGDSSIVTLSWATKQVEVITSLKRHNGNEYSMVESLAWELLMAEQALWKDSAVSMESALLAYLEANRTQVASTNDVHATWDAINYNYDMAYADLGNFYNFMFDDLQRNNYSGTMLDAYNTGFSGYIRSQVNQGQANATNSAFQYTNPFDFVGYPCNFINNSTSDLSIYYIIPEGGVCILDWNDPVNREGRVVGDSEWGTYQSRFFPGIMLDLFTKTACADTSSSGGGTQDFTTTYEMSFNYAVAKQPLSTSGETPIFKTNILSS